MFNEPFDRTLALKTCGVDSNTYRDTYATVSSILEINPQITFEHLGIQLGHPELTPVAKRILDKVQRTVCQFPPRDSEIQSQI